MTSGDVSAEARPARGEKAFSLFRLVALFEGLTSVALFCVAMPLKYVWGDPSLVPSTGMIHGWAWMAYAVAMVVALSGRGWSARDWGRTFLAGVIPLGTFFNDPFLKRRLREERLSPEAERDA